MKAIVRDTYGPPKRLRLEEVDQPALSDDSVLVRVRAASVNPYDWHLLRGRPYLIRLSEGLRRPKRPGLGVDVAGVVEAVGKNVTQLAPGDEVFGGGAGAFAEYVVGVERKLVPKPARLSFEEAAAIPIAGVTALQAVRDRGEVQPGQKVLINGASGGVGTFAVQIATWLGAEVTGVCSTRNVELVRLLGADRVVDYTRDDFTRGAERYDVIFDTIGNRSLTALRRALTASGTLVLAGGDSLSLLLRGLALRRFVRHRLRPFVANVNADDLLVLKELVEAGEVRPIVDRTYPLAEAAAAIAYVETRRARGKVVLAA
jgi:NADPH:quinone reductase-like Zn-dependent oxidoreductase